MGNDTSKALAQVIIVAMTLHHALSQFYGSLPLFRGLVNTKQLLLSNQIVFIAVQQLQQGIFRTL